jgi:hypothetical protein
MGDIQLNPLEGLVKIDHIQKEPPLNLKGNTGAPEGSECRLVSKADINTGRDNLSASQLSGTWEPFLSEFISFPSSSTWDVG